MYCPQCGTATEQKTKFCKACGLKLSDHARLLEDPREAERMSHEQWRREKRMMTGVVLTMVTALDLIIFLIIFASITLPHLEGKAAGASLTALILFLLITALLGGVGIANLISSGFFKNLRERQLRAELSLLEQKRQALAAENDFAGAAIASPPRTKIEAEAVGISEHTTRELQP